MPFVEQRGTEVVLLVEDEEAVRDLVHTILAGQGYDVIVALDPRHAEEIAKKLSWRDSLVADRRGYARYQRT